MDELGEWKGAKIREELKKVRHLYEHIRKIRRKHTFLIVSVAPAPRELSLLGKFSGRNVNLFTELQLKFRDDLK